MRLMLRVMATPKVVNLWRKTYVIIKSIESLGLRAKQSKNLVLSVSSSPTIPTADLTGQDIQLNEKYYGNKHIATLKEPSSL